MCPPARDSTPKCTALVMRQRSMTARPPLITSTAARKDRIEISTNIQKQITTCEAVASHRTRDIARHALGSRQVDIVLHHHKQRANLVSSQKETINKCLRSVRCPRTNNNFT